MSRAPRRLRVVVVDDQRDIVLTLAMVLRDEGHEVRGLHSGKDVLRTVRDFNPDALILDIAMPDLSGWEVARRIRVELGRRPVIIGISGEYRHPVDHILSQAIGFDHYLVKPCDPNAVLELLAPLSLQ